jgi:hypothetical protein
VNIRSHHWQHPATQDESDTIGTFYFHWAPTPKLYEIKTDEGFDLDGLMQELRLLELKALGRVKHADMPSTAEDRG